MPVFRQNLPEPNSEDLPPNGIQTARTFPPRQMSKRRSVECSPGASVITITARTIAALTASDNPHPPSPFGLPGLGHSEHRA